MPRMSVAEQIKSRFGQGNVNNTSDTKAPKEHTVASLMDAVFHHNRNMSEYELNDQLEQMTGVWGLGRNYFDISMRSTNGKPAPDRVTNRQTYNNFISGFNAPAWNLIMQQQLMKLQGRG